MSDDEDDYMSDKFLASKTDVRPSLIKDRGKKRLVEINQKHDVQIKRQREERLERTGANRNERLQESLQRPIDQANKGFQLLAKMGYKPGEALGKTKINSDAITEPIKMNIKTDRGGLGREAALRDLAAKRKQLREQYFQRMRNEKETITTEEYRRRVTAKGEERYFQIALRKCQAVCENLDISISKIETPSIKWFWPDRSSCEEILVDETPNSEGVSQSETKTNNTDIAESDEEDEIEYTIAESVEMITSYLRTSYTYCFWCGVHYNDLDDLNTNCPGEMRDEH